jgi:hypothetical protein
MLNRLLEKEEKNVSPSEYVELYCEILRHQAQIEHSQVIT